jgi:hypothetical protein
VDTDGTSLYFMVDFTGIEKTTLAGNHIDFNFFNGPGGEDFIEDISLVHPVTIITGGGDGHFFFSRMTSDDNSVKFDLRAELLNNDTVFATGITTCVALPDQGKQTDFIIPVSPTSPVVLQSGDVISARLSIRSGTNALGGTCSPVRAIAIRFYYDSAANPSQFPLIISPSTTGTKYYFHSDGTNCRSGGTVLESLSVTSRTLSDVAPATANTKCKHSDALTGAFGNPWVYFNVPTGTPGTPALWKLNAQP